jgi:hypothetical protein
VQTLLQSLTETTKPDVLWNMKYRRQYLARASRASGDDRVVALKPLSADLAFDDTVLLDVKTVWERITGADPESFLKFDAREGTFEED